MKLPQALQIAVQHHQAGRLAEAEALYRQILAAQPNHAHALRLLGAIAHQMGRHDLAVEWVRQSIASDPSYPTAHCLLGEASHALGRLDEAVAAFRRALQLKPDFPEACNSLGNALWDQAQPEEATAAFRQALQLKEGFPEAHTNLGNALLERGRLDEAIAAFRRALQLRPGLPEAHNNLGNALGKRGQFEEAIAAYRRALELKPDYPGAHYNLGNALKDRGQFEEAIAAYRRALQLRPDYPDAHYNLANALRELGDLDGAVTSYRRALRGKPDFPEACNNLGNALSDRGQFEEAIAAYRSALRLRPDFAEAHNNLGNALKQGGRLDEAAAAFRRAVELNPEDSEAIGNLAAVLAEQGLLDEAIAAYRHALELEPERAWVHSGLIYTLHFHPGHDDRTIAGEHERWNRQFGDPLKPSILPLANDRDPERRLRVGYVSADFRDHSAGRFALPLIERHDRERFEIMCYSGVAQPDWMTERFRALSGNWRNTVGVSDAQLAELIRNDEVDILVDLAMHTAGNRLPMFARQPAPVQVSWLGYPGGAGLRSIGYRLTDAHMEPPEERSGWSGEEPVRLPDCWCCYSPVGETPEVSPLPALSAGGVTFGSLNNFAKVNESVLTLWSRILRAVMDSRLLMFCPEGGTRQRVRALFGARGIGPERLEFAGFLPRAEYLSLYHRIDVGLDPFPCNGMTATCDALWMGAPVLTLPGKTPVSRAGLSLLSSIGLGEFAAASAEDYVRLAEELAGNLPRLAALRAGLRPRMQASPLMDAPRFARNVEAACREMWRAWCAGRLNTRE